MQKALLKSACRGNDDKVFLFMTFHLLFSLGFPGERSFFKFRGFCEGPLYRLFSERRFASNPRFGQQVSVANNFQEVN